MVKQFAKISFFVFIISLQSINLFSQNYITGSWNFDNKNNWSQADFGNDLRYNGLKIKTVDTKDYFDGAINIPYQNNLIVDHNISSTGLVNEYTIVMDIMVVRYPRTYAILQTDTLNSNDADIFIRDDARIGSEAIGYSGAGLMKENNWYRLAISVSNGNFVKFYLDGNLVFTGNVPDVDGSLALQKSVLLFADDNKEDNSINVADIKIYSVALGAAEIQALGGFDNSEPQVFFKPYLQTPTDNSIYVCWHSEKTGSKLSYGETENLGHELTPDHHQFYQGFIWNWVKIDGLNPDTHYYYQISTDSVDAFGSRSEIHKFKTQLADEDTKPFRFVLLSDNQTRPFIHKAINETLESTLQNRFGENFEDSVNMVIDLGDIVGDGSTLYKFKEEYFDGISNLSSRIPYMVTIGNHEGESEFYYHYMKYEDFSAPEGEKYYSFRSGKTKFIMLNSNTQGDLQLNWMRDELTAAENDESIDWVFVFCHHSGYSETWQTMDDGRIWVLENLMPALKGYQKIVMFGNGHTHSYSRAAYPEYNFWITTNGSAGGGLDRWKGRAGELKNYEHIFKSFDHYGYSIIEMDNVNKKLKGTRYSIGHEDRKLNNVIIDEYQRNLNDTNHPEKPAFEFQSNGAVIDSPVKLKASPFLDQRFQILSAQYKIYQTEPEEKLLLDTLMNYEDIYNDTGFPDYSPVDLFENKSLEEITVPDILFEEGKTYKCEVRYRNQNLAWSDWSDEASFTIGNLTGIEADNETVYSFKLKQNYPNPFNPVTNIEFEIPEAGTVKLVVYNIVGEKVAELVNDNLNAGVHKVSFDASRLSSGIYFYQLISDKHLSTNKMILIK